MAGGGSAAQTSGKKKARIEIIPLIDVVFFLLATFVLFTLSLNKIQSITLSLPVASTTPPPASDKDETVVLQVSDGGTYYWNRELISFSEIEPKLFQYKQSTSTPRVLVAGDERAKFGPVVQIIDLVRKSGIEQWTVETTYRATGR